MAILWRYLMVAAACGFFLLGLQLPSLSDQYAKRVDASLREATLNFQPLLLIAQQYTGGDIQALIQLHRDSKIAPFKAEAEAFERIYQRLQKLQAEQQALQTHLPGRLWHLLVAAEPDLRAQTLAQYTPTAALTQEALICGGAVALMLMLGLEILLALGRRMRAALLSQLGQRGRGRSLKTR